MYIIYYILFTHTNYTNTSICADTVWRTKRVQFHYEWMHFLDSDVLRSAKRSNVRWTLKPLYILFGWLDGCMDGWNRVWSKPNFIMKHNVPISIPNYFRIMKAIDIIFHIKLNFFFSVMNVVISHSAKLKIHHSKWFQSNNV